MVLHRSVLFYAVCMSLTLSGTRLYAADYFEVGDRCVVAKKVKLKRKGAPKLTVKVGEILTVIDATPRQFTVVTATGDEGSVRRARFISVCQWLAAEGAEASEPSEPARESTPVEAEAATADADDGLDTGLSDDSIIDSSPSPGTDGASAPAANREGGPSPEVIEAADADASPPGEGAPEVLADSSEATEATGSPESDLALSFLIGVVARGTTATQNPGMMLGARGALTFNDRFGVGLAAFGTLRGPLFEGAAYRNQRFLRFFYAGPEVSVAIPVPPVLDVVLRGCIAMGGVGHEGGGADAFVGTDFFWLVEPSVELLFEIASWLRAGVGFGYRVAIDAELRASRWSTTPTGTTALGFGILDGFVGDLSLYVNI